jgi:hypothetical protein
LIIVLEGPDGAGKTTFAEQLQRFYAWQNRIVTVVKKGPPVDSDALTEYLVPLVHYVDTKDILICDRWHLGELVYGPMLRKKSRLTPEQSAYIEMVLNSLGCHFIHVTAFTHRLEEVWDQRSDEDDIITREQLKEIREEYISLMLDRPHWVTLDNLHVNNASEANRDFLQLPSSPMPGRYVGPPRPHVLLIGDIRGDTDLPWPFVPYLATSGHWLMSAMLKADVLTQWVGIVNGNELEPHILSRLWRQLGQPPVVTLGRNAESAWKEAESGESYRYLTHPQYSRRFEHNTKLSYGQMIKEAMR